MGLMSAFSIAPTPVRDVAYNGLAALVHCHVLDRYVLLPPCAVALQCFHLGSECAGEFVEGALRAVLLLKGLNMTQPASEDHCRVVDSGHLCGKHGFHLVSRLNAADYRGDEG